MSGRVRYVEAVRDAATDFAWWGKKERDAWTRDRFLRHAAALRALAVLLERAEGIRTLPLDERMDQAALKIVNDMLEGYDHPAEAMEDGK